MGLESSYLSKIRSRQSIPFKELFKLCEKEKIDISLLMNGKEIKINMNYKLKILNIIENANDKELEIYYYMLKAEELRIEKNIPVLL
ncbi:MAG: hypothetical protein HRT40_00585 [Campylobacteraceae bacterium]|nr:hypothetical protein [Campylobacteraceae bacterium]